MTALPLSEVFGPTFQGEGPHTGRRCSFVRLGLCNLTCEWCDTPYTWDRSRYDVAAECPPTPITTIRQRVEATDTDLVVLSGGEPFIHQAHFAELMDGTAMEWHIETNGTIIPSRQVEFLIGLAPIYPIRHITVSPKINTSDPTKRRIHMDTLRAFSDLALDGLACFKFVITNPANDLPVIDRLVDEAGIDHSDVWLMPEGTTTDRVLTQQRLVAAALLAHHRGYSLTTRLHTLLWGDERGH